MAKQKKSKAPQPDILEPKWKTVEKVVALLEKSLSPESKVTHNVKLPCLSTGHLEQCDVLIETGNAPRITRTIVEVQKRNEKVKPNDFRGWCQKMQDVGANRLICVSAKPFSRSIKDKVAKEYGPAVLLVQLEALEASKWPIQIVDNVMKFYKPKVDVDFTIKPNPRLIFHPEQNPFKKYSGQLFGSDNWQSVIKKDGVDNLFSIKDLINEGTKLLNDFPKFNNLPEGVHKVPFSWKPKNTSLCFEGECAPIIQVDIVFLIEIKSFLLPFEISSYTQEGHNTLAWVARAYGNVEGNDTEIRFTLSPNNDGSFSMTSMQVFGIKEGAHVMWWYA